MRFQYVVELCILYLVISLIGGYCLQNINLFRKNQFIDPGKIGQGSFFSGG